MVAREVTWGDTVRIVEDAPSWMHPGQVGEICGLDGEAEARRYTVEFGDGSSVDVLAQYVEAVNVEAEGTARPAA